MIKNFKPTLILYLNSQWLSFQIFRICFPTMLVT
eukprot:UN03296